MPRGSPQSGATVPIHFFPRRRGLRLRLRKGKRRLRPLLRREKSEAAARPRQKGRDYQPKLHAMITESKEPQFRDCLHCVDCHENFDYAHVWSLAGTDHNGHSLRALTPLEFERFTHGNAEDDEQ